MGGVKKSVKKVWKNYTVRLRTPDQDEGGPVIRMGLEGFHMEDRLLEASRKGLAGGDVFVEAGHEFCRR